MSKEKIDTVKSVNINNTKLVNKLKASRDKLRAGTFVIYTGKGFKGPQIEVNLEHISKKSNDGGLHKDEFLSYMDFLILDIAQLFLEPPLSEKYGKRFTVRKFVKVMTGGECGEDDGKQTSISAKRLESIKHRIDYLANLKIAIDFQSENENIKKRSSGSEHKSGFISSPILPVKYDEERKEYYFTSDTLPLYEYASVNKQIIRVDSDIFFCNGIASNTDTNMLIKYYLIHEIMVMTYRNEKEDNFAANRIIYFQSDGNDLLSVVGFQINDKNGEQKNIASMPSVLNKIRAVHETVTAILEHYKEKGIIEDYNTLKYHDKGAPKGVEIVMHNS